MRTLCLVYRLIRPGHSGLVVPIKNTGWFAVICLPTSEFMDGFYTSLVWMAASLVIGLVVIGFIGWLLHRLRHRLKN